MLTESEVVILPEMEAAGAEALAESREGDLSDTQQAVAVYLAMRMVYFIAVLKQESEQLH